MPGAGRGRQGEAQPAVAVVQMLPQPLPLPLPPSSALCTCLISSPATAVHWPAAWHGCVCAGPHVANPLSLLTAALLPAEAEAGGAVGETGQLPLAGPLNPGARTLPRCTASLSQQDCLPGNCHSMVDACRQLAGCFHISFTCHKPLAAHVPGFTRAPDRARQGCAVRCALSMPRCVCLAGALALAWHARLAPVPGRDLAPVPAPAGCACAASHVQGCILASSLLLRCAGRPSTTRNPPA